MGSLALPRLVISDWDETVTVRDTISTVAQVAYSAKPDFPIAFSHYVDIYTKLYVKHVAQWKDEDRQFPTTDLRSEKEFQRDMCKVELSSVRAIEKDGLFKNVPLKAFEDVTVEIDDSFRDVAVLCAELGVPLVILSINWTELIIKNTLRKHNIPVTDIIVNRLQTDSSGEILTGRWDPKWEIRTAVDKRDWVLSLMDKFNTKNVCYVGDSLTDLLGMLETPLPVMVPTGRGLGKAYDLGIKVLPLSLADQERSQCVYEGTWKDVLHLLQDRRWSWTYYVYHSLQYITTIHLVKLVCNYSHHG